MMSSVLSSPLLLLFLLAQISLGTSFLNPTFAFKRAERTLVTSVVVQSYRLDIENNEGGPYFRVLFPPSSDDTTSGEGDGNGSGKDDPLEKLMNPYSFYCAFITLITAIPYYFFLLLTELLTTSKDMDTTVPFYDENKNIFDSVGKVWSKTWLTLCDCYPVVVDDGGVLEEILRKSRKGQAYLICANHSSWLDIPILCSFLSNPFKFIAKGSLAKAPLIGYQLDGGNHILISRGDRRSQLKTFKEGISWLQSGVSVMAFPEGQRSPDGRLLPFKSGSFKMATKTKTSILPITIRNAHAIMPVNSIFPLRGGGRGVLEVVVHDVVEVEGVVEEEIEKKVREAILSGLTEDQLPLVVVEKEKPL